SSADPKRRAARLAVVVRLVPGVDAEALAVRSMPRNRVPDELALGHVGGPEVDRGRPGKQPLLLEDAELLLHVAAVVDRAEPELRLAPAGSAARERAHLRSGPVGSACRPDVVDPRDLVSGEIEGRGRVRARLARDDDPE